MTDTNENADQAPAAYDPSEHNVDDVLEYVKGHPDEVEAILAAENASSSPRVTLVKALTATEDDEGDEASERVALSGTYVLEKGDNPSVVARRLYGRGSFGREIVNANPGVKWRAGVEIKLPEV